MINLLGLKKNIPKAQGGTKAPKVPLIPSVPLDKGQQVREKLPGVLSSYFENSKKLSPQMTVSDKDFVQHEIGDEKTNTCIGSACYMYNKAGADLPINKSTLYVPQFTQDYEKLGFQRVQPNDIKEGDIGILWHKPNKDDPTTFEHLKNSGNSPKAHGFDGMYPGHARIIKQVHRGLSPDQEKELKDDFMSRYASEKDILKKQEIQVNYNKIINNLKTNPYADAYQDGSKDYNYRLSSYLPLVDGENSNSYYRYVGNKGKVNIKSDPSKVQEVQTQSFTPLRKLGGNLLDTPKSNILVNHTRIFRNGGKLTILDECGKPQMIIDGGNRIFSRKDTEMMLKLALKAKETGDPEDEKALAEYTINAIKEQDNRKNEYV